MSSVRVNFSRKRQSDFDTSESDNEDDFSTVRKIRRCHQETTIKQSLTTRCRTLWQWFSELPLKDYLRETLYKTSLMHSESPDIIVLDDDDEDDKDVLPVDDDDDDEMSVMNTQKSHHSSHSEYSCKSCKHVGDPKSFLDAISEENLYSLPLKDKPRHTLKEMRRRYYNDESEPISTSTPFYPEQRNSCKRFDCSSEILSEKHPNGFDINVWEDKNNGHDIEVIDDTPPQRSVPGRHFSAITYPSIDVEILLDGKDDQGTGEDSDELEIISEVSPVKQKPGPLSKKLTPVKYSRTIRNHDTNFKDTTKISSSASNDKKIQKEHVTSNSFTAHQVVRLQEREQYKLLLDKIINGSMYHPAVSKSGSRCAEIQVDLTQDTDPLTTPASSYHFQKEVLKQPVTEFLQKYYKPCRLVSTPRLDPATLIGADRIDEDVKIIETKPAKPRFRSKSIPDFFSAAWIEELKLTISSETERRLQMVADQEHKIERYRKRRDATIAEENRRRDELAVGPVSRADDEFPALTSEMEHIIDSALDPSAANPCLVKLDNLILSSADISTLHGLNWLNDQVINFYMALIVERGKLDNYPSVYAYSSFFYSSLRTRGEQQVTRWTKKVDIFAHDILFIPLHLGMHWALAVIDNRTKKIQYYDSLRCQEERCLVSLQKYLVAEMKDKKKVVMDPNTYTMEIVKNIPQQMNGSDCGMFTLKYAEYISRDAEITFTQEHMQYFRRRMVYEMLTKQLMS